jgi:hypothetical protein
VWNRRAAFGLGVRCARGIFIFALACIPGECSAFLEYSQIPHKYSCVCTTLVCMTLTAICMGSL